MELLQLKYFKKVTETGRVSVAAEQMFVSPPAISLAISRLEKELGAKLFDRQNNPIVLNAQGKIFLHYVNRVLACLECAQVEMERSLIRGESGVHIAVATATLWNHLYAAFFGAYPEISLTSANLKLRQLDDPAVVNQYTFLLAERRDFPLLNVPFVRLFSDAPVLQVSPEDPLARRDSVFLWELTDRVVFLTMEDHASNRRMRRLLSDEGVILPSIYECATSISRQMVRENSGVALTTSHDCLKNEGGLVTIPVETAQPPWEQCLYWTKETLTAQEKLFKAFALQYFGDI